LWWFLPQHVPTNWNAYHTADLVLFGLLSFVVFIRYFSLVGVWTSILSMAAPSYLPPQKNLRVAFLTCYVPGKEPVSMLRETLMAIKRVRYPHDTWVLDEGNSEEVKILCQELGVYHYSRKGSRRFNTGIFRKKTKAGNHNAWRFHHDHKYDVVAQIDMDHKPRPEFLERTLGYFRDEKVGMVGLPEVYKNKENWIARGASEQSALFHQLMQLGYYGSNMPFLIGTSHLYRTKAMEDIGGYAPTIVEDHLTGMKLYAKGWKGVFVPEILAEGLGPLNWADYFGQQFRWSYGLFEIFFKHTPFLIHKLTLRQKLNYFLAQTYYFSGVAVLLGALLTFLYLVIGIEPTRMNIIEWVTYATPLFIMEQTIQLYIFRLAKHKTHVPWYGVRGKLLTLGANMIYANAFIAFLVQKHLSYKVTAKNNSGEPAVVPLRIFTSHIVLSITMFLALIISYATNHDSLMQRVWGVGIIASLSVVILSNYYVVLEKRVSQFSGKIARIFRSTPQVLDLPITTT